MWRRSLANPALCVGFHMCRVAAFAWALLPGAIMGNVCANAASTDIDIDDEKTAIFFSGGDLWRHGLSLYGGALWSPAGLDGEGFVLKLLLGGGNYSYISGTSGHPQIIGQHNIAFVLPGWRLQKERLTVSLFAGVDVQHHRLVPDDPASSLRGLEIGVRTGVDLWFEPSSHTMIGADASLSTVGPSYSARLAYGWRIPNGFYAGPEIGAFGLASKYRQVRAGLHITGFRLHDLEWSAGFGWSFDNDDRSSLYGRLGVFVRK
jgi:hypothetical protein